jgi:ribonuclease D
MHITKDYSPVAPNQTVLVGYFQNPNMQHILHRGFHDLGIFRD